MKLMDSNLDPEMQKQSEGSSLADFVNSYCEECIKLLVSFFLHFSLSWWVQKVTSRLLPQHFDKLLSSIALYVSEAPTKTFILLQCFIHPREWTKHCACRNTPTQKSLLGFCLQIFRHAMNRYLASMGNVSSVIFQDHKHALLVRLSNRKSATLQSLLGALPSELSPSVSMPGAYSPYKQDMHCMPSHLAKKENNNLNKTCKNLKQNQTTLPEFQVLTFKSN